jgi:hypothetical protein
MGRAGVGLAGPCPHYPVDLGWAARQAVVGGSPMTMQQALDAAMRRETADSALSELIERGVWVVDEDTMTHAIHNVYCGIMADHTHPNEKDRDQARRMIAAIGESIGSGSHKG